MHSPLPPSALDQLFLKARTHNHWTDRPLTDADIQKIYELAKFGATTASSDVKPSLMLP